MYQEISEELEQVFGEDIDTLASDTKDMDTLAVEIKQLTDTLVAMQTYGNNPTTMSILKTTGLLEGTSLQTIAVESVRFTGGDQSETQMATESLLSKAGEKVALWSAKLLSFFKNATNTIIGGIIKLWESVTQAAKPLFTRGWDKTKVLTQKIKAHPYKTVMACIAASAAVIAVMAFVTTGAPTGAVDQSALQLFNKRFIELVRKIIWPFGKVSVNTVNNGTKIVTELQTTTNQIIGNTANNLQWTQTGARAASGGLSRMVSSVQSGFKSFGGKILSGLKFVNNQEDMGATLKNYTASKTGSKLAGWSVQQMVGKVYGIALWGVVGVVTKLLKDIVFKTFQMVKDSFRSLKTVTQPEPV